MRIALTSPTEPSTPWPARATRRPASRVWSMPAAVAMCALAWLTTRTANVVASFQPSAFASSTTTPDPTSMLRTDYDVDGRVIVQWGPRYDSSTHSDVGLGSTTQTTQCPGNAGPHSVARVPGYPPTAGVYVTPPPYYS